MERFSVYPWVITPTQILFHLDFGFICASSADFAVSEANHIVTSYDGNNAYLLIVCAKARHICVFCQASKSPTIVIIERLLALRMDEGGEFWRSNQLGEVDAAAAYAVEPTGSDAAPENSKVERPNGNFGAMVRCLLYSAGLSEIFWFAALVHAVYLENCLYHKALHATPYEACTWEKQAVDHLHTFGALVMARKPGKRPAKADHHTDHGFLLGYGHYFDEMTNREKLSTHHTIDEAHISKNCRPPGPQILMDMGYEQQPLLPAITTPPHLHGIRCAPDTRK
jgi:hypothetical protein